MSKLQSAHGLITYYQTQFKNKFGVSPGLANRNKIKYLISDALEDVSISDFQKLMDYYLEIESEPSLMKFCYEYDDIYNRMHADAKDLKDRKVLLSETERRVMEFRKKFGK